MESELADLWKSSLMTPPPARIDLLWKEHILIRETLERKFPAKSSIGSSGILNYVIKYSMKLQKETLIGIPSSNGQTMLE
jgi:hypothetical protein